MSLSMFADPHCADCGGRGYLATIPTGGDTPPGHGPCPCVTLPTMAPRYLCADGERHDTEADRDRCDTRDRVRARFWDQYFDRWQRASKER